MKKLSKHQKNSFKARFTVICNEFSSQEKKNRNLFYSNSADLQLICDLLIFLTDLFVKRHCKDFELNFFELFFYSFLLLYDIINNLYSKDADKSEFPKLISTYNFFKAVFSILSIIYSAFKWYNYLNCSVSENIDEIYGNIFSFDWWVTAIIFMSLMQLVFDTSYNICSKLFSNFNKYNRTNTVILFENLVFLLCFTGLTFFRGQFFAIKTIHGFLLIDLILVAIYYLKNVFVKNFVLEIFYCGCSFVLTFTLTFLLHRCTYLQNFERYS